jgi:hypothetical protein
MGVMTEHSPKTTQGMGGNLDAQLWDISFKKGRYVILPPQQTFFVCYGEVGAWKPSAHP